MLFNSIEFALFFPIVLLLYWTVFRKNSQQRNVFIIAVSYFFYGFWDWRFLFLIIISSAVDFFIGKKLFAETDNKRRKLLLAGSVLVNIGFLAYFKYANFFIESFVETISFFGSRPSISTLNIILPVGISFYTFQTLSYTLDIYYKRMEPTKNTASFFAFVSFFPQLVAGPIERAQKLLPQFESPKVLSYDKLKLGALLIMSGLFKKIVIADRLAVYVDSVYGNIGDSSGMTSVVAALFFAFQLYFDFSAYSEIAIGSAKMLDFDLSVNFRRPYLARSFADFWRRWHISLSSWFRDYLYIPLGGSKKRKLGVWRNVMIVFLLSGLWHGSSWNFVVWGALNGLFLVLIDPLINGKEVKGVKRIFNAVLVTVMWAGSLVFFRASTFSDSLEMYGSLGFSKFDELANHGLSWSELKFTFFILTAVMLYEIIQEKVSVYSWFIKRNFVIRWVGYLVVVLSILFLGKYGVGGSDGNFIYFQF